MATFFGKNRDVAVQNIPEIRERKVGELLDAALTLLVKNVKVVVPFAAGIVLPFQILSAAATATAGPSITKTLTDWSEVVKANPNAKVSFPKISGAQVGAVAIGLMLLALSTVVLQAALTSFVGHLIINGTSDRKSALRLALRRFPILLASSFLIGMGFVLLMGLSLLSILVLKGFGILVVFGAFAVSVWLFVRFSAAYPPIMLEHAGPITALRRSFRLTSGMFWKVLGALMMAGLISGIAGGVISASLSGALSKLGGSNGGFEFLWAAIAGTVSTCLTAPFSAAVAVFLYFDLRVRKEGFDLERLADELGRRSLPKPIAGP